MLLAAKSFFQDCNAFSALSGQRNERTCCAPTFTFALTANNTGLGFTSTEAAAAIAAAAETAAQKVT